MLPLESIRECFEGVIPAAMATVGADGMPNIAYLSQVQYVDHEHVALSYQFFNKTRQNILARPLARLQVTSPVTGAQYQLSLEFRRTETAGPLFENMKARLAGIASHTGMANVFRLLGADLFRVHQVVQVASPSLPPPPRRNLLPPLREAAQRLACCADLESLLAATLDALRNGFGVSHAMVLIADSAQLRLYTVASCGYGESGVGSEIPFGQGVVGVAARERTPIRIGHMTTEYAYSRAIRENLRQDGGGGEIDGEIPLPGLAAPYSQMAVPVLACQRLLGVLYVESAEDLRFGYDDEDALAALATQLGAMICLLQGASDEPGDGPRDAAAAAPPALPQAGPGPPLVVRHFAGSDSIFLDEDYLIKGVAGAIFWTILGDYEQSRRVVFSNRELRLDGRIRLPDISDNLEARLLLLSRRLLERQAAVQLKKTGRGRFQLCVSRPVQLVDQR
ncbi:GAF domain-containing protein [Noviherbaspirillum suwonense]|uniref:GAF domain-containing protein n=1 Tax=Noviherbaspirillum suwonense TaxID=1224511 RepID=A0ABY1QDU2_9BURK|nr:GAF domain-containing protein [Noviherbaspirillum suwonense]